MWSHYADQHRGIALHYDFPIDFLNNPDEIFGVAPVKYGTNTVSDWHKEQCSPLPEEPLRVRHGTAKDRSHRQGAGLELRARRKNNSTDARAVQRPEADPHRDHFWLKNPTGRRGINSIVSFEALRQGLLQ